MSLLLAVSHAVYQGLRGRTRCLCGPQRPFGATFRTTNSPTRILVVGGGDRKEGATAPLDAANRQHCVEPAVA